jgi:hypothetical protein
MRSRSRYIGAILVVGALALTPAGAMGAKVKTCSVTQTSPNDNAQGTPFTTTETQTSACNSNSDTGATTTTVNGGGHPK